MRRLLWLAAPLLLLPLVSARSAPGTWAPRPATYGVVVEPDVRITMSDGVRLAVDVRRPSTEDGRPAPGRFPVVLTQTPYNKNGALNFASDFLVTRGYVQVIADVRGTGSSEGVWRSFDDREQKDSAEIVEWVASREREWSNGRIALHGTSYGAINQLLTMQNQPRHIRAAFPIVPMADAYRDIALTGGQINTSFIPAWLGLVTALGAVPPTYVGSDPVGALIAMSNHAGGALQFQTSTVLSAMTGGDLAYDGPFWRTRSPIERINRVRVPTFIVGGWSDLFQRGEPLLYQALRRNRVPSRLLMGDWTHIAAGTGTGLPAQGVPALNELELRWFDHYVRGVRDRTLDRDVAPVTYNRLGDATWQRTSSWPPPATRFATYRLSGPAMPTRPGRLIPHGTATGSDLLPWSPAAGVCSRSTTQWSAGAGDGAGCDNDNRVTDAQGVAYDLPVTMPLKLAGPVAARLFISSSTGRDTLLTARLEDVSPDGTSTQLSAGWNVLSMRALDARRSDLKGAMPYHLYTRAAVQPIDGSVPYEVWVEIFPTAALIRPGHSLRLSIQAADTPHLSSPVGRAADPAAGLFSVHHDDAYRSSVMIPITR